MERIHFSAVLYTVRDESENEAITITLYNLREKRNNELYILITEPVTHGQLCMTLIRTSYCPKSHITELYAHWDSIH